MKYQHFVHLDDVSNEKEIGMIGTDNQQELRQCEESKVLRKTMFKNET